MEESLIYYAPETKKKAGGELDLLKKRIEFHPARKPFLGYINNNSSNFHLETLNPSSSDSSIQRPPHPSLNASAPSGKKLAATGDFFDPELCFGITVRRIGAGLENLGNTCFLNSVLQCLTYTEPFAAYLQSGKHKSSCHTAGFCAMCAIQNHVKRALQSTGRILAPKDLVMNLRCVSRNFRNARQEDAHEYMVNLLESMHKCCLPSGVPSESPSAYEKSLVHKIFGGRLRSQVKCMQCSYCSNTFDPFLDLSLEIMKADSLHKALRHFTAVEQLDGGEKQYQCQRCKQKVKALKQLTVHKAPYVLSVHLKRFGSHVAGQKIDKRVEFSPNLDLKPFVSGSYEGDLKYTLYGVLVHAGWSTHSGHYYCFVRTSSGMWHSLDDNRVVQVSEKTVLQQKAYMLFYVRDRRPLAPKKPIDQIENLVPSAIENKERRASVKLNESLQNGPSTMEEIQSSDSLKKPQLKDSSLVKITRGLVAGEDSSILKDPMSLSSKTLVNNCAKQSAIGPFVEEVCPQSTPSIKGSNSSSYPTIAVSGIQQNPESFQEGSDLITTDCNGSQRSDPKKLFTNKNDIIANKGMSREPQKISDIKCENNISARLPSQSGTENGQYEGHRVSSAHSHQKTNDNDRTSKETRLAEPSIKSCKRDGFHPKEALCHHRDLQKALKPKKKVTKSQIATIHLHSRFLLKTSLICYKKKKQKKDKRRSQVAKSHTQVNCEEDFSTGGLEPSTSEKKRVTDLISTRSKRRQRNSDPEKSNQRARNHEQTLKEESVKNGAEGDLREGNDTNSAVLASSEPLLKCSTSNSEEKERDPREPNICQVKRGLFENGLMSMLTRGLEEYTVARWDETESSPSQHLGSKDERYMSIGYVPDEWDEEYDRGKRKKVRNQKGSFGEPNTFQETGNAKFRKAEVNKSRSRNQPLRIR